MSYLELQAGNTAMGIFAFAVLMVFLVLAAQYESWSLPLAVILVVPLCLLSAIVGRDLSRRRRRHRCLRRRLRHDASRDRRQRIDGHSKCFADGPSEKITRHRLTANFVERKSRVPCARFASRANGKTEQRMNGRSKNRLSAFGLGTITPCVDARAARGGAF